jgi:hypothetical protein
MLAAVAVAVAGQARVLLAVLVVAATVEHQTQTHHLPPTILAAEAEAVLIFQFAEMVQTADLVLSLFLIRQLLLIWQQLAGHWYLLKQPLAATQFTHLPAGPAQFLGDINGTLRRT